VTEVGRYLDATLEAVLLNAAESRSQSQTPPAPAIPTTTIGVVFVLLAPTRLCVDR
jgi:hypothetical protein